MGTSGRETLDKGEQVWHQHSSKYLLLKNVCNSENPKNYKQSWPKISAPLVNIVKNLSALLILLLEVILFKNNSQKSKIGLDNKNLQWGEIS